MTHNTNWSTTARLQHTARVYCYSSTHTRVPDRRWWGWSTAVGYSIFLLRFVFVPPDKSDKYFETHSKSFTGWWRLVTPSLPPFLRALLTHVGKYARIGNSLVTFLRKGSTQYTTRKKPGQQGSRRHCNKAVQIYIIPTKVPKKPSRVAPIQIILGKSKGSRQ
jgi:hypothetical protein